MSRFRIDDLLTGEDLDALARKSRVDATGVGHLTQEVCEQLSREMIRMQGRARGGPWGDDIEAIQAAMACVQDLTTRASEPEILDALQGLLPLLQEAGDPWFPKRLMAWIDTVRRR